MKLVLFMMFDIMIKRNTSQRPLYNIVRMRSDYVHVTFTLKKIRQGLVKIAVFSVGTNVLRRKKFGRNKSRNQDIMKGEAHLSDKLFWCITLQDVWHDLLPLGPSWK